jgi:multiple sugar transport system substrate-binding protein
LKAIAAEFTKENPGIKVTTNWIQSDYEQKLQTTIAAGTESTVMEISNTSLAGFARVFQEQQVDPSVFVQLNIAAAMRYNGKYYAAPFNAKPKVMAVNVDMFKAAGIPLPDKTAPMTRDQFTAIATKLSSGQGASRVFGTSNLWFNGWLAASGGSMYNSDGTSCTFGDETGVGTAKWIVDAQAAHIAPTATDIQGQDQAHWFAAGRLATYSDFGPWTIADFVSITSPQWTLVPDPGKGFPMEIDGLGISRRATGQALENAKKFVAFVSTQAAAQNLMINGTNALGVPVIEQSTKTFESVLPADRNLAAFTQAMKVGTVGVSVAKDPQVGDALAKGLASDTALGNGNEDVATVLPRLQQQCNDILKS